MATPNDECITYDCSDCHGLGIVKLYSGQSPSLKEIEISCPGTVVSGQLLRSNRKSQQKLIVH